MSRWSLASLANSTPSRKLFWNPRYIRNDAARSIRDMATCATTSALRPQRRLRPCPSSSPSADLRPFTRSVRVLCSAGARPQKRALRTDSARLAEQHARVHPERDLDRQLGGNREPCVRTGCRRIRRAIPPSPPRNARTRLSVRSSRIEPEPAGADRQPHGDLARPRPGAAREAAPRRSCTPPAARRARGP